MSTRDLPADAIRAPRSVSKRPGPSTVPVSEQMLSEHQLGEWIW